MIDYPITIDNNKVQIEAHGSIDELDAKALGAVASVLHALGQDGWYIRWSPGDIESASDITEKTLDLSWPKGRPDIAICLQEIATLLSSEASNFPSERAQLMYRLHMMTRLAREYFRVMRFTVFGADYYIQDRREFTPEH